MNGKIKILPGVPNDDNRHYLPEELKGSDMVVNENGNNSLAYPERLKEYSESLLGQKQDSWFEYVPASYDGSKKVPLVLSMHGGAMTGWGQALYSCWTLIADREGFIVAFPNASEHKFWIVEVSQELLKLLGQPNPEGFYLNQFPENPDENYDMNFIVKLIEKMKQKYNIDESRIYMQGMSMGDMMSCQFGRYHGELLAGIAGSAGPMHVQALFDGEGKLRNRSGALAVFQSRMELDQAPPGFGDSTDVMVKKNRLYWKTVNGCDTLPQISIQGEDNFAFYQGKKADYVFRDVKNRDHGQTLDDAEIVWDYFFSGVRRSQNGSIERLEPNCPRTGDVFGITLAAGSAKAYVHSKLVEMSGPAFLHQKLKYHGLNGGSIVRGEYFMAPVSFLAETFGAKLTTPDGGLTADLTLADSRTVQFARGSIGCVVENHVHSMFCEAVYRGNELFVPIEWFCCYLFQHHTSACDGTLYITDHDAELSVNMAHLIRDEILA